MTTLTLEVLQNAVASHAAGFRCITEYQPLGGAGDKVFPPTYEGGKYATEKRVIEGGEVVDCVLLDSVQSQANRMELTLLDAVRNGRITLPLLTVFFNDERLKKKFTVTSLEAPHRIADALLRDSLLEGVIFRKSTIGKTLDTVDTHHATSLFGLNPTALVFGLWDSTGPRGGLGAKFQRAIVSEIIGYHVQGGVKTSSRIDPAQIMRNASLVYSREKTADDLPDWTLDPQTAIKDKNQPRKLGKDGKPSEANHGNVTPGIQDGGVTLSHAKQTTVISLSTLRRLRFPLNGDSVSNPAADIAARTTLAALGLLGAVLAREQGADLRSRCQLYPTQAFTWELVDLPGKTDHQMFDLTSEEAIQLFNAAVQSAKETGLPWEGEILLTPSNELIQLVARSQELASHQAEGSE